MNIFELKQKRTALVTASRALLDAADSESRGLSEDEKRDFDEMGTQIDELTRNIKTRERLESFTAAGPSDLPAGSPGETREEKPKDLDLREMGEAIIEKRDYTTTMNSSVFQSTIVQSKIREGLPLISQLRSRAVVTTTSSNETIPVDAGDVAVSIIAQGGAYGDSAGTLNPVEFKALKVGGIVKISDEALAGDTPADIASNAMIQFARAVAKKENLWHLTGTGSGQPQGILTGGTQGEEAAGASALTAADIRGLVASVPSEILANAFGWCNQNTMGKILELCDKNKGITVEFDPVIKMWRVMSVPFFINDNMPEIGAGLKPIIIGDPAYYEIKDRTGLEVKVLDQLYAGTGFVGYRHTFRSDAHVMDAAAFKYLAHPAS